MGTVDVRVYQFLGTAEEGGISSAGEEKEQSARHFLFKTWS